jgi:hypothetical protein
MASMSSKPELNPEIKSFFSGISDSVKGGLAKMKQSAPEDVTKFPIWGLLIILVVIVGLMIWYFKRLALFENVVNIRKLAKNNTEAQADYDAKNPNRVGIRQYLGELKKQGVPDTQLCLTNFYVSTVNAAGVFFPAEDGVVSPMAARAAVLAGARCFVLDIWPDLSPDAKFGPSIQVVESGSLWRRISMNSLPFVSILKALVQEAFEMEARPGSSDPLFLYLRFRGKSRAATYTATANALRTVLEQYRLDHSYNTCRGQDTIFTVPITSLFKKVVIISNTKAEGNILSDYINIGPKDGIKMEWGLTEARGLSTEAKADAIRKVQQNLTFVAPLSETPEAEKNAWDFTLAQSVGIHFCAMNFWNRNDKLQAYMDPAMFGKQSFLLKPLPLRYVIELLPAPKYPENPGWGTGATAGKPTEPPGIKLP